MSISKVAKTVPGLVTLLIYTTIGELSSTFDEFLAVWSQFDSDDGVDFYTPTCCQSATFVRPFLRFIVLCFFTKKIINNVAFSHRSDVYAARLMALHNR